MGDVVDGLVVVLGLKGSLSASHLIEQYSCRPHIYSFPVSPRKHFRRPIEQSPRNGEHIKERPSPPAPPGNSEVDDLDLLTLPVKEDIL